MALRAKDREPARGDLVDRPVLDDPAHLDLLAAIVVLRGDRLVRVRS